MVTIQQSLCLGCGNCVDDCVSNKLYIEGETAHVSGNCFGCGHCVAICPANAVSLPEYDMEDVEEIAPGQAHLDPKQLLRAIKFRRSIRRFMPFPIEKETLDMMLQAGRYSATAKNTQGCRFVVVQQELAMFRNMVWDGIGEILHSNDSSSAEIFRGFYEARQADPQQDFLFRDAPMVLLITAKTPIDAGLAIQNMELMGNAMGVGFLFNGYLQRAVSLLPNVTEWLGIQGKTLAACALVGHPVVAYLRTAPRKRAKITYR